MGKLLRYEKGHGRSSQNRDARKRFRLCSDGTVLDQDNDNRVVGFITGHRLDEIFSMKLINERQKAIRDELELDK